MTAKITVCMTTYNRAHFISQALDSLCDQGLPREEYVVAISDNASDDGTREVVANFANKLHIVYRRNSENIGRVANTRAALSMCETPYLSWLNDDDLLAPGQLRRALTLFDSNPAAVLVASLSIVQSYPGQPGTYLHGTFLRANSKTSYAEPYTWDATEWLALALVSTPLSLIGSVFKHDVFERIESWKKYHIWGDRLLLAEMVLHGRVLALPWVGGYYRTGSHQLNNENPEINKREFAAVTAEILHICRERSLPVEEFWVDQLLRSSREQRLQFLKLLRVALPTSVFKRILQGSRSGTGNRFTPYIALQLYDLARRAQHELFPSV
jgi:glycosyltransferase involved in cell wall biosynthesis